MLVPDFGAAAAAQMQQAAFEATLLGLSPDTRYKSDKAKQEDAHPSNPNPSPSPSPMPNPNPNPNLSP